MQNVITQSQSFGLTDTLRAKPAGKGNRPGEKFDVFLKKDSYKTKTSDIDKESESQSLQQRKDNVYRDEQKNVNPQSTTAAKKLTNNTDHTNIKNDNKVDEKFKTSNRKDQEVYSEQLLGILQALKVEIMNTLGLSEEEFDHMLLEQGGTIEDLFQIDFLKEFVLRQAGEEEITALLTNETLAKDMTEILQTLEELKSNSELTESQMEEGLELLKGERKEEAYLEGLSFQSKDRLEEDRSLSSKEVHIEAIHTTKAEETRGETNTGKDQNTESSLDSSEQWNLFVDHLAQAAGETTTEFEGQTLRITEYREIANQIVERIKIVMKPEQTSMELQLNPEHLGRLNLTVSEKSGVMTAQFVVQNEVAKEAIETQMHVLRETLSQQELKVEAIEVTVSNFTFEQGNHGHREEQAFQESTRASKRITLEEAMGMAMDEETKNDSRPVDNGSLIDYTA